MSSELMDTIAELYLELAEEAQIEPEVNCPDWMYG